MNLLESEIRKGLVVFLDPVVLADDPLTECNTKLSNGSDICVKEKHLFIVIENAVDGRWLVMPLFSRAGKDRELLKNDLKQGSFGDWAARFSYLFRWQQWLVPTSALIEASVDDQTIPGSRLYYNASDEKLREWSGLQARNRTALHRPRLAYPPP